MNVADRDPKLFLIESVSGFSTRARTCLSGIYNTSPLQTLGDIAQLTPDGLMRRRGCGLVTLENVREVLATHGLKLKGDDWYGARDVPKEMLSNAARKITYDLGKRWDPNEAVVLADWLEERSLTEAAERLRKGPSRAARAIVDSLACCFGFVLIPNNQRITFSKGWPEQEDPEFQPRTKETNG